MSLRLLLDENISSIVAEQARLHCPEIVIESAHLWRGGAFVSEKDEPLLLAALSEGWTLVTYDRKTIPPLLVRLLERGQSHAGIVYIDERSIESRSFGLLIEALIDLWETDQALDWQDRIYNLGKPKR